MKDKAVPNGIQTYGSAATAKVASQPKGPGGAGFLINHAAFTDARPPAARGMKKSAGYPNFPKK